MTKCKSVYEQRFHVKDVEISISYLEGTICICCGMLSKCSMDKLLDELECDGYADGGEVEEDKIYLTGVDPWMCCPDNLKEIIQAKMESMNYEVKFFS